MLGIAPIGLLLLIYAENYSEEEIVQLYVSKVVIGCNAEFYLILLTPVAQLACLCT